MTSNPLLFDRALLARRLDRVAATAAAHDFLLARVADDFADRLSIVKRHFAHALNIDAYHGALSRRIRSLDNVGTVVDCSLSGRLLTHCDGPRVLADVEALPFAEASFDLVVSGLSLQFVNDLPGALVQLRRALKPDGLLMAAILGGQTLHELKHSWLEAEAEITGGASPRVAPFADVRELGGLLQRAGFALNVADSDSVTVTYDNPLSLMREVKAMGASNPLAARSTVPVGKAMLMRAAEVYRERFALPGGRVPATFEVVTLTGWVPHENQPKPLRPGSAQVSLAEVLGGSSGGKREPD